MEDQVFQAVERACADFSNPARQKEGERVSVPSVWLAPNLLKVLMEFRKLPGVTSHCR